MLYWILLSYVVPLLYCQDSLCSLRYTSCSSISVLFGQHLCYICNNYTEYIDNLDSKTAYVCVQMIVITKKTCECVLCVLCFQYEYHM